MFYILHYKTLEEYLICHHKFATRLRATPLTLKFTILLLHLYRFHQHKYLNIKPTYRLIDYDIS